MVISLCITSSPDLQNKAMGILGDIEPQSAENERRITYATLWVSGNDVRFFPYDTKNYSETFSLLKSDNLRAESIDTLLAEDVLHLAVLVVERAKLRA